MIFATMVCNSMIRLLTTDHKKGFYNKVTLTVLASLFVQHECMFQLEKLLY